MAAHCLKFVEYLPTCNHRGGGGGGKLDKKQGGATACTSKAYRDV